MTHFRSKFIITLAAFFIFVLISFMIINSQNQPLATPDLIQRAFDGGEITEEQRLLYLAYAIFEYESLPARYRGDAGWRGTSTIVELNEAVGSPSILCSMSPNVQSEIRRLLNPDTICDQTLSTPALIDQAFANGEITAEQRLLYLAYAVFEYESLPAQFRSNIGWRGTSILEDLEEAANSPSVLCSMGPDVRSEFKRLLKSETTCD